MNDYLYEASIYGAKTAIVLLFVIFLYRVLGKRFVAQFNVYDLVTVSAVSNAVQNAMTEGKGNLEIGLVSAATLIGLGWFLSKLFVRAPRLQKLVSGIPTLLVYEGKIFTDRMKRESVSSDELRAALQAHGLSDPKECGMAVLEPDGSISIVPAGRSCKFDTNLV